MSLCISWHQSASLKKEHVSAFLGVSYKSHVTQMVAAGNANFVEKVAFSVISALNEVFEDEEESEKEEERSKKQTAALVATLM